MAPSAVPSTGIWLVVHKDNRDTARIRAVLNHITLSIRNLAGELVPVEGAATRAGLPDGAHQV